MITVEHLTKKYGDFLAVDDLSFTIEEGHVYGFLGPNGAGKSTTMNIMTGCLSATEGTVKIDGHDIFTEPDAAKKCIGYLPEQPPLYMNETPTEYLRFVAEAKGLKGEEINKQVERVIELTKIDDVVYKRIGSLSKGYKQRVGIAQALLGDPKVVILDEPTVGLDPLQIIEIRELIAALGKERTVILSSHILSEVQTICDRIIMIAHGKLIADDTSEDLVKTNAVTNEINFVTEASEAETKEILKGVSDVIEVHAERNEDGDTVCTVKLDTNDARKVSKELFFAFADRKKALYELSVKKANLENIFIELAEAEPEETADEAVSEALAGAEPEESEEE